MIISFEGLPGCRKKEIYQVLENSHGIRVKRNGNIIANQLFQSDTTKYALAYEFDRLHRIHIQYAEDGTFYDSLHSLREVYINLLQHRKVLEPYQVEVFQRYYDTIYKKPDYIIYLYGSLDAGYQRAQKDEGLLSSVDDYKKLRYQYEWVFDVTNCKIPMFKVNVEDDVEHIVNNILAIIKKIETIQSPTN